MSLTLFALLMFFNSHPHKEDDFAAVNGVNLFVFSTHILTRRMTQVIFMDSMFNAFSTHILTRRMTNLR